MARSSDPHREAVLNMIKPAYLLAALLMMLVLLAGLGALIVAADSSPFDDGATPSLVSR